MRKLIIAVAVTAAAPAAIAGGVDGTWRTEAGEDGGYLEVTMAPCETDPGKTCGTISKAFNKQGPDPDYENLGKLMVKDMTSKDGTRYSGGTIWDPEKDKTYKSKMELKDGELDVEGCISFICSGQDWKRVK